MCSVSSAVYISVVVVLSFSVSSVVFQGCTHSLKSGPTINSSGVEVLKSFGGTYTVPGLHFVPPRGILVFLLTSFSELADLGDYLIFHLTCYNYGPLVRTVCDVGSYTIGPKMWPGSYKECPGVSQGLSPVYVLFSPSVFASPSMNSVVPRVVYGDIIFPTPFTPGGPCAPSIGVMSVYFATVLFLGYLREYSVTGFV